MIWMWQKVLSQFDLFSYSAFFLSSLFPCYQLCFYYKTIKIGKKKKSNLILFLFFKIVHNYQKTYVRILPKYVENIMFRPPQITNFIYTPPPSNIYFNDDPTTLHQYFL